jgi:nucleoid-associated protein YgaU
LDDLQTALTATDIPDEVLLKALAVPLWICWATLAGAILSEAAASLRGATLPRLPVIGPFQAVAAALVGTITLSVLTASRGGAVAQETTRHVMHEPPQVVPVAAAPAVPGPVAGPDGTAAAARAAPDLSSAPAPRGRGRTADRKADAGPTYTVRKGDSLWRIAERTLGDGARYKQIAALNYGRPQADGRALTDDHRLRPGWELRLPPDVHGRADAGPAGRPVEHVVSEGDTLWDIAEAHLGDGASWPRIYELNAHRPQPDGRSLTDPDLIHPGWVLRLPAPASGAKPTTSRAEGRPAPPSASPPASPPSPPASAQGVPGDAPTPSSTATATPTSAPTRGPSSPPDAAPAERPGATDRQPGVDLPGGWVGLGLAAALVAAGGMVWLQRRRRYIPGQLAGPELNDPDLAPLPAALRLMRRRVRVQAPELLDPPPAQPTVAESAGPDPAPLPPIGPSGPDLAGLGALPPAGLGLAGPGGPLRRPRPARGRAVLGQP